MLKPSPVPGILGVGGAVEGIEQFHAFFGDAHAMIFDDDAQVAIVFVGRCTPGCLPAGTSTLETRLVMTWRRMRTSNFGNEESSRFSKTILMRLDR
ncbi:MAG: hypothetical protein R2856_07830 [Caldilineaceae bacterium]